MPPPGVAAQPVEIKHKLLIKFSEELRQFFAEQAEYIGIGQQIHDYFFSRRHH